MDIVISLLQPWSVQWALIGVDRATALVPHPIGASKILVRAGCLCPRDVQVDIRDIHPRQWMPLDVKSGKAFAQGFSLDPNSALRVYLRIGLLVFLPRSGCRSQAWASK